MATVLVTGSTDGIGKQTATELAEAGHVVIVHGRDADKGARVVEAIREATGSKTVRYCNADFARLAEVRRLADDVARVAPALDVVINNAAVFMKRRVLSDDGHEMTLAVNFLAPFVLTNRLLAKLPSAPRRIVHVAALVHAQSLQLDNLQGQRSFSAWDAYARSKLYLMTAGFALAKRLDAAHTGVFSLHPGVIDTKMLRKTGARSGADVSVGARRLRYAATAPELSGRTGEFLVQDRPHACARISRDPDAQRQVWALGERLG